MKPANKYDYERIVLIEKNYSIHFLSTGKKPKLIYVNDNPIRHNWDWIGNLHVDHKVFRAPGHV